MKPNTDSEKMLTSTERVTLEDIYREMIQMKAELNTKLDCVLSRIDQLEQHSKEVDARLDDVEFAAETTESQINAIQNDIQDLRGEINSEVKEQFQRMQRINNIVIFGIPESVDDEKTLEELLKIIWPEKPMSSVQWTRIGPITTTQDSSTKSRPIRITTASTSEKIGILRKCKLLKGNEKLKNISVQQDMTKQQQKTRKLIRAEKTSETRPSTRAYAKRKHTEPDTEDVQLPSSKKRNGDKK